MPAVPRATAASSAVTSTPHAHTTNTASTSWTSDDHFLTSKESLLQSERTSTRKLSKSPAPTLSSIPSAQRPTLRKPQVSSRLSKPENPIPEIDSCPVRVCPRPTRLATSAFPPPRTQFQHLRHSAPTQKSIKDPKADASVVKRPKSQSPAKLDRSGASSAGITGPKTGGRKTSTPQASSLSSSPSSCPTTPTSESSMRQRSPPTLTKVAARVVVKAVRNAIFPPKDNPFVYPSEQQRRVARLLRRGRVMEPLCKTTDAAALLTSMDGDIAEYEVSLEQVLELDETTTEVPEKKVVKPFVFKTAPTRSCAVSAAAAAVAAGPPLPVSGAAAPGIPASLAPAALAVLASVPPHQLHNVVSFDAEEDFERELGIEVPDEEAELRESYGTGVLEGEDEYVADDEGELLEEREQSKLLLDDSALADSMKQPAGLHFLEILNKESMRLTAMVERAEWELRDADHLPENAQEKLRAATGQGRLLITKKLKQFEGLCRRNVAFHEAQMWENSSIDCSRTPSPTPHRGQDALPITAQDLAGFWDMVKLQVDHVDRMFGELNTLRRNCWMERGSTRQLPTSSASSGHSGVGTNSRLHSATTPPTVAVNADDRPLSGSGSSPNPRVAARSASSGRRRTTPLVMARSSAPNPALPSVALARLSQPPALSSPIVKEPTPPRDTGRSDRLREGGSRCSSCREGCVCGRARGACYDHPRSHSLTDKPSSCKATPGPARAPSSPGQQMAAVQTPAGPRRRLRNNDGTH